MGKKWLSMTGITLAVVGLLMVVSNLIAPLWSMAVMTAGFLFAIYSIRDWWRDSLPIKFFSIAMFGMMIFAVGFWELYLAQRWGVLILSPVLWLGVSLLLGGVFMMMMVPVAVLFRRR